MPDFAALHATAAAAGGDPLPWLVLADYCDDTDRPWHALAFRARAAATQGGRLRGWCWDGRAAGVSYQFVPAWGWYELKTWGVGRRLYMSAASTSDPALVAGARDVWRGESHGRPPSHRTVTYAADPPGWARPVLDEFFRKLLAAAAKGPLARKPRFTLAGVPRGVPEASSA